MKEIETIKNIDIEIEAPPSKAHTLRAISIASLAEGRSIIINPLLGEDQKNLINCIKNLGIEISIDSDRLMITGNNGKYIPQSDVLNVGESGVSMNFLCSLACLAEREIIISGDESLCERPINEVVSGLTQLGCEIQYLKKNGFPPVRIKSKRIPGGKAVMNGKKTSQYFSSIAIAAPYAASKVELHCSDRMSERPYFDISMAMMSDFGVEIENNNYTNIIIPNDKKYCAREIKMEGDYSSAAFFFLAAAICKSAVQVTNLSQVSKQGDKVFVELLHEMGCEIAVNENGIKIIGKRLTAIKTDMKDIPDLVPPLAIACAYASGTSRLSGVGHLRNKECNRLQAIVDGLAVMNVKSSYDDDSLTIDGCNEMKAGEINPRKDHRIAMSFAVAGLPLSGQIIIDESCVKKSFPDFWNRFKVFYI
jgi:3-phosphoshikimate 1-carboxyvinyltransferase